MYPTTGKLTQQQLLVSILISRDVSSFQIKTAASEATKRTVCVGGIQGGRRVFWEAWNPTSLAMMN